MQLLPPGGAGRMETCLPSEGPEQSKRAKPSVQKARSLRGITVSSGGPPPPLFLSRVFRSPSLSLSCCFSLTIWSPTPSREVTDPRRHLLWILAEPSSPLQGSAASSHRTGWMCHAPAGGEQVEPGILHSQELPPQPTWQEKQPPRN